MLSMLIVDDETIHVEGIAMLTRQQKLPVRTFGATSGQEALQILHKNHIDILFTDIKMPLMDGLTLSEKALALQPDLAVIIYSSFGEFEYAQQAIRLGIDNYILKPIRVFDFIACMNKVIVECRKKREMKFIQSIRASLFFEEKSDGSSLPWDEGATPVLIDLCGRHNMPLIKNILQKLSRDIPDNPVVELNEYQLLFIREGSREELREYLNSLCGLVDSQPDQTLLLLMGITIWKWADLKAAYEQMEVAAEAAFFLCKSRILDLTMENLPKQKTTLMNQERVNDISHRIVLGEYTGAEHALSQLFASYADCGSGEQVPTLKFLCSEIVRNSVMPLKLSNPSSFGTLYITNIYSAANSEELKTLMTTYIRSYVELKKQTEATNVAVIFHILQYIEEKYMNDINLETIAEKVHLSPSYVSYLFKKETGKNFMKYLTEFRIEKAKILLKTTSEKVTYISKKVGYNNGSYFCMIFRSYCGVTPAQYREQTLC